MSRPGRRLSRSDDRGYGPAPGLADYRQPPSRRRGLFDQADAHCLRGESRNRIFHIAQERLASSLIQACGVVYYWRDSCLLV